MVLQTPFRKRRTRALSFSRSFPNSHLFFFFFSSSFIFLLLLLLLLFLLLFPIPLHITPPSKAPSVLLSSPSLPLLVLSPLGHSFRHSFRGSSDVVLSSLVLLPLRVSIALLSKRTKRQTSKKLFPKQKGGSSHLYKRNARAREREALLFETSLSVSKRRFLFVLSLSLSLVFVFWSRRERERERKYLSSRLREGL